MRRTSTGVGTARVTLLSSPSTAIYALFGLVYIKMGRAADAAAPMRMAMRLDPNQPMNSALLGIAEFAQARFAEPNSKGFARRRSDDAL